MTASVPVPAPLSPDAPLPLFARRWGYAGLAPFVTGALFLWLLQDERQLAFVTLALQAWGALIVSFMAAIAWGVAMLHPEQGERPYLVSSLLAGGAWLGLLMPGYAGLVVEGALLVGVYLHDRRFYPRVGLGHWLTLRFRLSVVAAFCCFLGAAAV